MFCLGTGAVWSGDTKSTWEDFNQQFRAGLNMVMSGERLGPLALLPTGADTKRLSDEVVVQNRHSVLDD